MRSNTSWNPPNATLRQQLTPKMMGQLIAEIAKFGGSDKKKASALASILLPHIEQYGQGIAREALQKLKKHESDAFWYLNPSGNASFDKQVNAVAVAYIDHALSELTQKPPAGAA